MTGIIVSRAPADKPGPDVIDPLLSSEQVAVARGAREIDYHSTNRMIERGNCPMLPFMDTGSTIRVTEAEGPYNAKLIYWSLTIDISQDGKTFTADSSVTMERVM